MSFDDSSGRRSGHSYKGILNSVGTHELTWYGEWLQTSYLEWKDYPNNVEVPRGDDNSG